jgi:hypothetical protein
MFSVQLTTLRYRSTDWLIDRNIPVNTRECSMLTDIWVTLYVRLYASNKKISL